MAPASCRRRSDGAPARSTPPAATTGRATACRGRRAHARGRRRVDRGCSNLCGLSSNSNYFWLAGTEGDDAPDRIVRRDANGHAIARDYLDAEAAHSAAELGQYFMACVALHAV